MCCLIHFKKSSFAPYSSYALYDLPRTVCTADFDGDCDSDIAVAILLNPGFVSILPNHGDGTFTAYEQHEVGGYPNSVFAADFDGDGDIDLAVSNQASNSVSILLNETLVDVPELDELSKASVLFQNHSNPFNPTTEIRYALHRDAYVKFAIYNILRQRVITLVDEYQQVGYRSIDWDARNHSGNRVASGAYFYQLQAGDFIKQRRWFF